MTEPKKQLVEDVKPVPVKERAPLGVVELTLSPGQTVRAHGVVYGIEHRIAGDDYEVLVLLDQYNQRIKALDYDAKNYEGMLLALRWIAEANGFDKLTFMARRRDFQEFLKFGYVLEAVIRHYHAGEDAFVVSKFRSQERLTSLSLMEEILLVERILAEPSDHPPQPMPEGHAIRFAGHDDIPALIELYQSIFETYPSPLMHSSYLETILQRESIFAVATFGGEIVAAASAELHRSARSAEMTDCATRPSARGLGLMSHLLSFLESELHRREYSCAFTMARARSFGMNRCFYRLGYTFMGRLVNNCDIFGTYEDMNIWVKPIEGVLPAKDLSH